eukprot:TRINITY_DN30991_c0_g1_i1.p1 TRINITY_DN30991_c0_g1~~TRINITY_DN30991_c0_g1_i1.p1  ORF type:complete len:292 (+),score=-0.78 TRINITY_DN30991_c0_g1_i1:49-924(+)
MTEPQSAYYEPPANGLWATFVGEIKKESWWVLMMYVLCNLICVLWAAWVSPTYTQPDVPWWLGALYALYLFGAFFTTASLFTLGCGVTKAWVWIISVPLVFGIEIATSARLTVSPFVGTLSLLMAQVPIDGMLLLRLVTPEQRWTKLHFYCGFGICGACFDYVTDFTCAITLIVHPDQPTWAGIAILALSGMETPLILKGCAWPLHSGWYWAWLRLATVWLAELPVSILTLVYLTVDRKLQIFSLATTFLTVLLGSSLSVYQIIRRNRKKNAVADAPPKQVDVRCESDDEV